MKPSTKVYEHLSKYNFYLPSKLEEVSKLFYAQMVANLGLADNFKNSFISQIAKINQIAQNQEEFCSLVRLAWNNFLEAVEPNRLIPMGDQECSQFRDLVQKVVLDPKLYEQSCIDELLNIYEIYLQSNRGLAFVIQKKQARVIITKLVWSKFLKQLDETIRPKFLQFFVDIYLKKIECMDQVADIKMDDIDLNSFYQKMFEFLIDYQQESQGTIFNFLNSVILKTMDDLKAQQVMALEIFRQYYFICLDKEKFLFEKWDLRQGLDQKLVFEIVRCTTNNQPLKDTLRTIVAKLTQKIDYKKLMKELIARDIYAMENEQVFLPFFKEFEQYELKYPRKQNEYHENQSQFGQFIRFNNFRQVPSEKIDLFLYQMNNYLISDDRCNGVFKIKNKMTNEEKKTTSVKELAFFMKNH